MPEFTKDHFDPLDADSDGVIHETDTDLEWQDDIHYLNGLPAQVTAQSSAVRWRFHEDHSTSNDDQGSLSLAVIDGGLIENVAVNSRGVPQSFSLNPFNGADANLPSGNVFDVDVDTSAYMRLSSGASYNFNVDSRCVTGSSARFNFDINASSATEYNIVLDDDEYSEEFDHETEETLVTLSASATTAGWLLGGATGSGHYNTVQYDVSEVDMYGFSFEGNTVIEVTADIVGNIVFDAEDSAYQDDPSYDGDAGDVTFTFNSGSVLYGDLVFGARDLWDDGGGDVLGDEDTARNAAHDVVLTNAGSVRNIDLQRTDNVTFTNTGSIGTPGGYGLDARNVTTGITINNSGSISNIDGSYSPVIEITNSGSVGGILLNDSSTSSASAADAYQDVRTIVTNTGTIGLLTADRIGILEINNSGTISSSVDTAITLSASATIDFVNSGTIAASSSDTIDLTEYTGNMTLTNRGQIRASTNSTIDADGSSGTYTFNNFGTIRNTNNRALSLRNLAGGNTVTVNNGGTGGNGTLTSNQTTVALSASSASNNFNAVINNTNGSTISANFGNAVDAINVASFTLDNAGTMSSNVNAVLQLDSVDRVGITNSGTISTNVPKRFRPLRRLISS